MYEVYKPFNKALPEHGLFDFVLASEPVQRRNWAFRLVCRHKRQTDFRRTDYRGGPGGYSDSYEGSACRTCGAITQERQVF